MSNSKNLLKLSDLIEIHHEIVTLKRKPTIIYHDDNGTNNLTCTCFYDTYCILKDFDGQINYSCAENIESLPTGFRL